MREGKIYTWSLLQYGFIVIGKEIFFLHGSEIIEGLERAAVGARIKFDVDPPLAGKRHPRAVNAVIGSAQ